MLSRLILTLSTSTSAPLWRTLSPRVRQQLRLRALNKFCRGEDHPFIDASYDELSEYMNCMEKTLVMKRECIAERGIWTAKKRCYPERMGQRRCALC